MQLFAFALFFIFGGITALNDVIIPKPKQPFTLGYAQAMLIEPAWTLPMPRTWRPPSAAPRC